mmetsp:Transcript_6421/g.19430  ORF Transcript_6421/g.19430 Transcript_6421/m.19430 type:complete len:329 (-) Transcript_6421:704-1690(-)
MGLCVEHVGPQVENVVVAEYEEQILERLSYEEAVHDVSRLEVAPVVVQGRVAALRATVRLNALKDVPRHVPEFGILRVSPHVEERLQGLRAQFVPLADLDGHTSGCTAVRSNDGSHGVTGEASGSLGVEQVACVRDICGKRRPFCRLGRRVGGILSKNEDAWKEAGKVVHLVAVGASKLVPYQGADAGNVYGQLQEALDGVGEHGPQRTVAPPALQPHLEEVLKVGVGWRAKRAQLAGERPVGDVHSGRWDAVVLGRNLLCEPAYKVERGGAELLQVGVAGGPAQGVELQLQRSHFGKKRLFAPPGGWTDHSRERALRVRHGGAPERR